MSIIEKLPPYLLTIVVGLAICWFALAPHPLPENELRLFANADKVAHVIMFGALCGALYIDLWRVSYGVKPLWFYGLAAVGISSVAGGLVEILQDAMDMNRSADWLDFLADVAGALLACVICYLMFRRYPRLVEVQGAKWLDSVKNIYMDSFPAEERREWSEVQSLLEKSNNEYNINFVMIGGAVRGLISSWQFDSFVYIEHFAMAEDCRGLGVGGKVLRSFCRSVKKAVILEVERIGSNDMAARRIGFYERNGFKSFPEYNYIQPPYAPGLPSVPLMLMATDGNVNLQYVESQLHSKVYGKKQI